MFPPTFAGAVYAVEQRRVFANDGKVLAQPVTCVVLDTVQSQANRMEQALQEALDGKRLNIPVLKVDFSKWSPVGSEEEAKRFVDDVGTITSLPSTAPARGCHFARQRDGGGSGREEGEIAFSQEQQRQGH